MSRPIATAAVCACLGASLLLHACGPAEDPAKVPPAVLGPRVYQERCLQCHGAAGEGLAQMYPPLAGSPIVQGDLGDPVRIVLHGLEGSLEIGGRTFNNQMPSWASLHDAEIAAVLTFVRSKWGNAAGPVTMEQVAQIRAKYKDRSRAWTMDQLKYEPK